ncbi:transcription factor MYB34 [Gossypium australe]|uniref:Transcription factor MYB34 n=1 Tax=Gossypium australe TaxID=47621 RepID=A0A5B6WSB3_9ROSI|nr:transcription factor MYB34 [Gossypium australe]
MKGLNIGFKLMKDRVFMSLDQIIGLLLVDPEIEQTFRQRIRERIAQRQPEMDPRNQNNVQGNGVTNVHNPILIADYRDRAIRRPKIKVPQFELKPVMFQMLQTMGQFSGMSTEDPHFHLRLFMEVSNFFKIAGVTKDALRLKLFP